MNLKEDIKFKEFFFEKFDSFRRSKIIYYKNICKNDCDSIDLLINLTKEDLIDNIKLKKMHLNLLINLINKIKIERNKFILFLEKFNMLFYLKMFDKKGIYYFEYFYKNIKNIQNLNKIIKNNKDCEIIFKNTPKYLKSNQFNNEGIDDTQGELH